MYVHKQYGALHVLNGVDLTVQKGDVLSIIGGSGSGKSTMLICINGLEKIQQGRMRKTRLTHCRHSRERGLMRSSHAVSLDLSRTKPC
jgi:ABC-type histidine transport system ATPase subunit